MWTVGYIVTPVLFQMLDKSVAGNVAGQLFSIVSYIGIFSAVALVFNVIAQRGFSSRHWQLWTLLFMLIIIAIGEFVLQPMMSDLKLLGLSGEAATKFGRLHGIASVLFLLNSLVGLALVIFGLHKK